MSQHDLVLDNAAGATFRTDVNAALVALASTSKGTARPPNCQAGQLWLDDNTPSTSVWTLYLYDGVGDITVGTFETTTDIFTPANSNAFPPGGVIEYYGTTAPTGWLFPYGQEVSRSTYSALYAILGTTYGGGDGSTTFNLPDKRGRVGVGRDNMGGSAASRVTTAGGGLDGATLGATGGAQSSTALIGHSHSESTVGGLSTATGDNNSDGSTISVVTGASAAGTTTGSAGSGSSFPILPPGIVCNFLIKT